MSEIHKLRFVAGQYGEFWSARFHDFYAFLERGSAGDVYDLDKEPGFKVLKGRPKWLLKSGVGGFWSSRSLPRGGYIEPLDWDENDFKEYLDELDAWVVEQAAKGA